MPVFSITPLLTGARNPDQGIMTYQKGYGKKIWLPVWVFLLRGDDGGIYLVDTGLAEDEVMDPPGFFEDTGRESKPLTECLEAEGLKPEDIQAIICTHLHDDHCGNAALFPDIPHYVQKAEADFARDPHPLDHRYDWGFVEDVNLVEVEGDCSPLPGVELLFVPGHAPGTQAVRVETPQGPATITGFCCNKENFPAVGPAVCPGVHTNALAAYDNIQRIKALGGIILPMHEMGNQRIG